MAYPEHMLPSLLQVSQNRTARLHTQHPELSVEAKQLLLQNFHPDFNANITKVLRHGVNAGESVAQEIADLLECPAHITAQDAHKKISPSTAHIQKDVLIIGSGGAGLAAALWLKKNTSLSLMVSTKLRTLDSNTVMAEGGISAATAAEDNPGIHFVDTMVGGRFANNPDLVEVMVSQGPLIIDWLASLGVNFDCRQDGEFFTHRPGGHSRTRSHSIQDITGLEMARILQHEARNIGIEIHEFCPAVELLLDDKGHCAGAILQNFDTKEFYIVHAKAVILASGGMGRLHPLGFPTSNFYGATADGLAMGYRAGAKLIHMDSVQYHPTGTAWPHHLSGLLISEAVRAQGAQLLNAHGEMFIGNLETRDALAAAIIRESFGHQAHVTTPTGQSGVWLDTVLIDMLHGEGTFARRFANIYNRFMACGIDPSQEPVLVYPTQHYQNGGLAIDAHGQSSVPYLYAAGEVAGGVHGKNRLGGNALLDIFVFGHVAAQHAAHTVRERGNIFGHNIEHALAHDRILQEHCGQPYTQDTPRSPLLLPDYRHEKAFGFAGMQHAP